MMGTAMSALKDSAAFSPSCRRKLTPRPSLEMLSELSIKTRKVKAVLMLVMVVVVMVMV